MKIRVCFIFTLLIILMEVSIIFNIDNNVNNKYSNDSIECYRETEGLPINEIVKNLEESNINLLNITKENGEYLIKVSINENKDEFIKKIHGLNTFLIKDYELKWKENIVDGILLLKYNTINEV